MNSSGIRPVVSQLGILVMGFGLWAALVLLFTMQFVLVGSLSWSEAFKQAIFFWGLWGVLIPAVVWLSFQFPFERPRLPRNVGIHLLACTLVVMISQLAFRHLIPAPFPPLSGKFARNNRPKPPPPPFEGHVPQGFLAFRAGLDSLVYWSLVGVCQAITNFRRSQQRERRAAELEARLTRSKLQALRMQVNPHFLFNTLNAISTLVYVNPRAADEMLGDLSELLRSSLDTMEEQEVPLASELQFIRAYIAIEQKRFGDRLGVAQQIPDDLLQALVPTLILQPLVENAIRHGIEPRRAPGLITLKATQIGKNLHLLVLDNGTGDAPRQANRLERRGIGLANTQARLRELYGSDHRFTFGRREAGGWEVEITLPFHTEHQHDMGGSVGAIHEDSNPHC